MDARILIGDTNMSINKELTDIQKILIRGLGIFGISLDETTAMILCLTEAEDQISMIEYMMKHREATPQEVKNEFHRIIKQRKKLQNN